MSSDEQVIKQYNFSKQSVECERVSAFFRSRPRLCSSFSGLLLATLGWERVEQQLVGGHSSDTLSWIEPPNGTGAPVALLFRHRLMNVVTAEAVS